MYFQQLQLQFFVSVDNAWLFLKLDSKGFKEHILLTSFQKHLQPDMHNLQFVHFKICTMLNALSLIIGKN